MKKSIPILLIAFAPLFSIGQAYIPMDLDTSSFWVIDYYWGGQQNFTGERVCQIVGDTVILSTNYKICNCYTTKGRYHPSPLAGATLFYDMQYYLREDTLMKKVMVANYTGATLHEIEFGRNVGDTSNMYLNTFNFHQVHLIDSVKMDTYPGSLMRRTTYSNHHFGGEFKTIEGVGSSHSFPEGHIGEWGIAMATCRCYSKGGSVQYLNGIVADSCYRKIRQGLWAMSQNTIKRPDNLEYTFYNNNLILRNAKQGVLNVKLFSINGSLLYHKRTGEAEFKKSFAHLPSGVYILSMQSAKFIDNKKIIIH